MTISDPAALELGFDRTVSSVGIAAPYFKVNATDLTASSYAWSTSPSITNVDGSTASGITINPSVLTAGRFYTVTLVAYLSGRWYSGAFSFTAVQGSTVQ